MRLTNLEYIKKNNPIILNFSLQDLDGENWKSIRGFIDMYEVSTLGRVKSLGRNIVDRLGNIKPIEERILHQGIHFKKTKNGLFIPFVFVHLRGVYVRGTYNISRLVAEAFKPNPFNCEEVMHKDRNTINNNINNLEWVTASERAKAAYSKGRQIKVNKGKFGKDNKSSKKVKMYTLEGKYLQTFTSRKVAAEWLILHGFATFQKTVNIMSNISHVIKGAHQHAYSHIWKNE